MNGDIDAWRNKYWECFQQSITTKHEDWNKEEEYRLLQTLTIDDAPNCQILKYKFCDLDGVIFGIKTLEADKLKFIEIVKRKCKSLYGKVKDFVELGFELDYEAFNMLLHIIKTEHDIYMPYLTAKLDILNIKHEELSDYKCILKSLLNNAKFKELTDINQRENFNFYQAYFCYTVCAKYIMETNHIIIN